MITEAYAEQDIIELHAEKLYIASRKKYGSSNCLSIEVAYFIACKAHEYNLDLSVCEDEYLKPLTGIDAVFLSSLLLYGNIDAASNLFS